MRVVETIGEMKEIIGEVKKQGVSVGLVPTMGFLHEGHLTLMREAKKKTGFVVASIFVNPIQFGVGEDYEVYPRDLSRDCILAETAGVDVIFAPEVRDMYPRGFNTYTEVFGMTDKLCGLSRPGHFKGVTTVVAKLFHIVEPDLAFFGQKDAQQVAVINKMVQDMNMNLEIQRVATVREADGLAMSSRNSYLSREERSAATVLYKSLQLAESLIEDGTKAPELIREKLKVYISEEPLARIDYVEILSYPDLEGMSELKGRCLIALAVFIGKTRLIDNFILEV